MKKISLTQGKFALVDDDDFERVNRLKWFAGWSPHRRKFWAGTNPGPRKTRKTIFLHRFLMDAPRGIQVDHINGDPLDNRKCNLRLCTNQENSRNRGKNKNNTLGYKGVNRIKSGKEYRYQAGIGIGGGKLYIGLYKNIEDAARAYDEQAKKLHGEFARLNFPKQPDKLELCID